MPTPTPSVTRWRPSGSGIAATTGSTRSPAGSSAACSSPARSRPAPTPSCSTSPPPGSTPTARPGSRRRCAGCATTAAPSCSSPTSSARSPASRPAPSCSVVASTGRSGTTDHPDARTSRTTTPGTTATSSVRSTRRPDPGGLSHVAAPYDFMQRALVAAALVGLVAPLIGVFLVQRRLALLGDGMGHVALSGVGTRLPRRLRAGPHRPGRGRDRRRGDRAHPSALAYRR